MAHESESADKELAAATQTLDELVGQWAEAVALTEDGDAESIALKEEMEAEIFRIAEKIAKSAGIVPHPPTSADANKSVNPVRPMEVQWDDGNWYACEIEKITFDFMSKQVAVHTKVLGYEIQEVAAMARIRPWNSQRIAAGSIIPGTICHVVHPETGLWAQGKVDRATLKGTVWVTLTVPPLVLPTHSGTAAVPQQPPASIEFHPSRLRIGKIYKVLKKKLENLTEEEKQTVMQEDRKKKRERAEEKRRTKEDILVQNSMDWQGLMSRVGKPTRR